MLYYVVRLYNTIKVSYYSSYTQAFHKPFSVFSKTNIIAGKCMGYNLDYNFRNVMREKFSNKSRLIVWLKSYITE